MRRKRREWITGIALILMCLVLFCVYVSKNADKKAKENAENAAKSLVDIQAEREANERIQDIDDKVSSEILEKLETSQNSEGTSKPEEKGDNPVSAITDAVKGALNEASKSENLSDIEILEIFSSNNLKIRNGNEEYNIRLIGVHSNGSVEGLKILLLNSTNLKIETDTKKTDGDNHLVYLWDGEPNEKGDNMINIQMISNGYAYSTYDFVHPGVIENPNIKYQSLFINAIKNN